MMLSSCPRHILRSKMQLDKVQLKLVNILERVKKNIIFKKKKKLPVSQIHAERQVVFGIFYALANGVQASVKRGRPSAAFFKLSFLENPLRFCFCFFWDINCFNRITRQELNSIIEWYYAICYIVVSTQRPLPRKMLNIKYQYTCFTVV